MALSFFRIQTGLIPEPKMCSSCMFTQGSRVRTWEFDERMIAPTRRRPPFVVFNSCFGVGLIYEFPKHEDPPSSMSSKPGERGHLIYYTVADISPSLPRLETTLGFSNSFLWP